MAQVTLGDPWGSKLLQWSPMASHGRPKCLQWSPISFKKHLFGVFRMCHICIFLGFLEPPEASGHGFVFVFVVLLSFLSFNNMFPPSS